MTRVVKVVSIVSLCVGATGVVGGCIGCYHLLPFLRGDLPEMLRPLEATERTIDLIDGALVQDLERQIAEATDGFRKAELRNRLAKMKEEAGARKRGRHGFDEGIRRDAILFTVGHCIWIAVSALLAVSALCVLRAIAPSGRRLLVISLALTPLTFFATWLLSGYPFFLPWAQFLRPIAELVGLSRLDAVRIGVAIVSASIALLYPPVVLVLLWRAKRREAGA